MSKPLVAIIGAGPYGLSYASFCQSLGIDYVVYGKWMDLWVSKMHSGSILRSHVNLSCPANPDGLTTIHNWLYDLNGNDSNLDAHSRLSVTQFLLFMERFTTLNDIKISNDLVATIASKSNRFVITSTLGEKKEFTDVVVATGLTDMRHSLPIDNSVAPVKLAYSDELTKLKTDMTGKRIVIVGSGQSAAETAVFLKQQGAEEIIILNRNFEQRFVAVHKANSPAKSRQLFELQHVIPQLSDNKRFKKTVSLLPPSMEPEYETLMASFNIGWKFSFEVAQILQKNNRLVLISRNNDIVNCDMAVLCTGYKVHSEKLPFALQLNQPLQVTKTTKIPIIDKRGRTSIPGLYMTGALSIFRYGPQANFIFGTEVITKALISDLIARY